MKTIQFDDVDFTIDEDVYPYTESKKIVSELQHWFNDPIRLKDPNNSNYSLDTALPNSLGTSFETKLKNGVFNLLRYQGEVIAFAGMYLETGTNTARGSHRMCYKPNLDFRLLGVYFTYMIPHQIETARSWSADAYAVSVNHHNYGFFNIKRNRKPRPGRIHEAIEVGNRYNIILSEQPVLINNVEQWEAKVILKDHA